jgi:hypothetical protein
MDKTVVEVLEPLAETKFDEEQCINAEQVCKRSGR